MKKKANKKYPIIGSDDYDKMINLNGDYYDQLLYDMIKDKEKNNKKKIFIINYKNLDFIHKNLHNLVY